MEASDGITIKEIDCSDGELYHLACWEVLKNLTTLRTENEELKAKLKAHVDPEVMG